MLLGLYTSILDKTNRIALPGELGTQLKDGIYITQGFDRNIMVLTRESFDVIYKRITSVNLADPLARLLLRMILGSVYKTEVEEDGSIPILDTLKSFARLSTEVVLVGQGDFLEIWSPEIWSKQEEQLLDVEKDPNRFSMLTLSTR